MEETLTLHEGDNNEDLDRISKLPDDVLIRIISFLPTKSAVATSILAARWKDLYTSNPNLDFDDETSGDLDFDDNRSGDLDLDDDESGGDSLFAEIVSKLLRSNTSLTSLRLSCGARHGQSTINNWISTAFSRNLRKLHLSTRLQNLFIFDLSQFCSSTLKTLQVLELRGCKFPEIPESVVLPGLRVLFLEEVDVGWPYTGATALASYFRSCPQLEEFTMNLCWLYGLKVFQVCHAMLKKFASYNCVGSLDLVFDTPNLQHLEFNAINIDQKYIVKKPESLVTTADGLRFRFDAARPSPSYAKVANFISEIHIDQMHKLCSLHLSLFTQCDPYASECPLATHENVTFLELDTLYCYGRLFFEDLLESFPKLGVLVFYTGLPDINESTKETFELRLPEAKPACLSKTLRELRIGAFCGEEYEMEVVKYFLTNGEVLRKVILGSDVHLMSPIGFARMHWTEWEDLGMDRECVQRTSETLAGVPKSSKTCQIVLSWAEDGKPCRRIIN